MPSAPFSTAAAFLPERRTLGSLQAAAQGCRGCPLYQRGTQTVFGEGPRRARLMLVGEQPGNEEDLAGHPFVGPAGRILDRGLLEAGIPRSSTYVTNIVKHFKWVPKGRRRLHQKPTSREVGACLPWLEAEIDLIKPHVIVCLGATAAQGLLGLSFRVTKERGHFVESKWAPRVTATVHPSSILRASTDQDRQREMRLFVADLQRVAAVLREKAA